MAQGDIVRTIKITPVGADRVTENEVRAMFQPHGLQLTVDGDGGLAYDHDHQSGPKMLIVYHDGCRRITLQVHDGRLLSGAYDLQFAAPIATGTPDGREWVFRFTMDTLPGWEWTLRA